ncbi:pentapeptide repeat-containing protein [Streptomyces sp. NRRL S-1022]|uniref:pentapeptide repeat-containing protein n=1 Tax=Streptomyces sp. NRRL S-1022 TaxID=1463880 RepID=UPI00055BED21|nr:pentapeptide repeat-containing protein [Streptomyces sp. NRRL S-1022]
MWIVAPLAVLAAIGAGCLIYQFVVAPRVTGTADALKTTIAILTLVGAILAGVYAYRKQRLAEGDAHRADAGQLADRYTTAASQLGDDKPAVRLAGVYALARLADDWEEQRQVCIDVLCAYLRMPYQTDPTSPEHREAERQVRLTLIRVIRDHLQDPGTHTSWSSCNFDFTGATFDGGDLSGSKFCGAVNFRWARFSGFVFDFGDAKFFGGTVDFRGSKFRDGFVSFRRAKFSGSTVDFHYAEVSGSTVDFSNAEFSNGQVVFAGAEFSGGTVDFRWARFSGGKVDFRNAEFSGGTVDFRNAEFSGGTVNFRWARFSGGKVDFRNAEFSGGTVDMTSVGSWKKPPTLNRIWLDSPPEGLLLPCPPAP